MEKSDREPSEEMNVSTDDKMKTNKLVLSCFINESKRMNIIKLDQMKWERKKTRSERKKGKNIEEHIKSKHSDMNAKRKHDEMNKHTRNKKATQKNRIVRIL